MRLLIFYFLLFSAQGFLVVLAGWLPAPDLFLIGTMTLLWRLSAWRVVLIAYGVGLLQDIVGYGYLGLHALGIAGGLLLAMFVASQLSEQGLAEHIFVVTFACIGKWLVFLVLLNWLSVHNSLEQLWPVAPLEIVFTVLASLFLLPLANRLLERDNILHKGF